VYCVIRDHLGPEKYQAARANEAVAAALVHDLGHGPFSHSFEDVGRRLNLKMADHEKVSDALIRDSEITVALNVLGSGFANDVADIIASDTPGNIYGAVVSSQFDADRLDYMRRDRLMTGTHHGAIDFEWLVANLTVGDVPSGVDEEALGSLETFVLGTKAIYAAETYVIGLFQLYPTVYFHKATRGAEKIFTELLVRVFHLIVDASIMRSGLPAKHPLVRFARKPDRMENALHLDDTVIWGALTLLAEAKDPVICDLARRLRDRKLYKSIDVREEVKKRLGLEDLADGGRTIDRACASIREKVNEWVSEQDTGCPRILADQEVRKPYKQIQESKGPLNQIRIMTRSGKLVDLGERSKVVGAIEPFQLYRLYVPEEDDEARAFVDKLINKELEHGENFEK